MRLTRRLGRPSFFAVCLIGAVLACSVPASAGNEVNYQDPLTAAPPIARPPTQSCSVTVMQDFAFNSSVGQGVFNGTLAPPAACPGPWSKVVLDFTGKVAGRQFDRLMNVWVGGTEVFQSSTPEPDPDGITWHVEHNAKGKSCDEFWFGSQPDDFAGPNGLCGGGAFREVQVSIDGRLAGIAWPFPFVFTGGVNPWLWRAIPAVNAFDMPPQAIDLTPYVGLLTDGAPHTIGLRVAHDGYYWGIGGDLLLYRDPVLAHTTGAVTSQEIAPDAGETYGENVGSNGGVFTTSASRHLTVSGYVDTSAGRITTSVDQTFGFGNKQELDLTNFLENLTHDETIDTVTTTAGPGEARRSAASPSRTRCACARSSRCPSRGRRTSSGCPQASSSRSSATRGSP